ncbi:LamG-like jellyroll fold domain-containing protein [Kribbella sp. VKM Ac-2568]|uniref:LamG-like jellyroll fold domain-containing protein n=1 Tax=Kribbella sp. VKM Ac-2568 TaxID=2512219 RepID=UPI00104800C5|nr:LamG-like jellyroll fold domain-containing protein [Kribbella sp. VKM Ac-2568]TCM41202.1 concanavalin A-like lectin/glucanase superfamily protein [Kribbella sp. VKM Ac-2568]
MDQQHDGTSRRRILQVGALGAGAALTGGLPAAAATTGIASASAAESSSSAAALAGSGRPDPDNPRFTLAVVPDTQYLFDLDRGDPAPLTATFKYLIEQRAAENLVFTAHLGDVVENAQASEFAQADPVFGVMDQARMPYSVLAGNHDIDSSKDDQRGDSAYLRTFGPRRFRRMSTYGGSTPDGYNSYHVFRAAGRQWLLLAMDWRPSDAGFAWARKVIAEHPKLPVILTIHDLVYADAGDPVAKFSEHGDRVWEQLVEGNDQIFLTLNGHYWPSGRVVRKNAAGNDVHLHITNYQDRYYGGSAMVRLHHFDLARDTIDVETISPWILAEKPDRRSVLAEGEIELTDPTNRFSISIDFTARFAGFDPEPARPARPARDLVIPGTVAYWRLDGAVGSRVVDHSGRGNDLTAVLLPGSPADSLKASTEHHPDQPAHASWIFAGRKNPARGGYLRTADDAPLNRLTFRSGYTIEAFVKLADDGLDHSWEGLLSRMGTGADAGKTGSDPSEPVVNLAFSGGRQLQWAVYPLDKNDTFTNWGHEEIAGRWFHLAVVNDGRHTALYIDSSELLRNPATPSNGLSTTGAPWLLGANHYANTIEQSFAGHIGELRIVDHPLTPNHFLTA